MNVAAESLPGGQTDGCPLMPIGLAQPVPTLGSIGRRLHGVLQGGQHFPPRDPEWKGAPSDRFLAHAAGLVRALGGVIVNVDVTIICEAPKVSPHIDAMKARIAEILDIAVGRVSVKGTTTEGMGFTGRGEGIATQALANVSLPHLD